VGYAHVKEGVDVSVSGSWSILDMLIVPEAVRGRIGSHRSELARSGKTPVAQNTFVSEEFIVADSKAKI
jgi:hypothetical protein